MREERSLLIVRKRKSAKKKNENLGTGNRGSEETGI